jgi:hypothetical protein
MLRRRGDLHGRRLAGGMRGHGRRVHGLLGCGVFMRRRPLHGPLRRRRLRDELLLLERRRRVCDGKLAHGVRLEGAVCELPGLQWRDDVHRQRVLRMHDADRLSVAWVLLFLGSPVRHDLYGERDGRMQLRLLQQWGVRLGQRADRVRVHGDVLDMRSAHRIRMPRRRHMRVQDSERLRRGERVHRWPVLSELRQRCVLPLQRNLLRPDGEHVPARRFIHDVRGLRRNVPDVPHERFLLLQRWGLRVP